MLSFYFYSSFFSISVSKRWPLRCTKTKLIWKNIDAHVATKTKICFNNAYKRVQRLFWKSFFFKFVCFLCISLIFASLRLRPKVENKNKPEKTSREPKQNVSQFTTRWGKDQMHFRREVLLKIFIKNFRKWSEKRSLQKKKK